MNRERSSETLLADQSGLETPGEEHQPDIDLYEVAEFIFLARVEHLKEIGELRRETEITTEEELDDHFEALSREYRQVCRELGLDWPPPSLEVPRDDN